MFGWKGGFSRIKRGLVNGVQFRQHISRNDFLQAVYITYHNQQMSTWLGSFMFGTLNKRIRNKEGWPRLSPLPGPGQAGLGVDGGDHHLDKW